jgi:hypothetical protein
MSTRFLKKLKMTNYLMKLQKNKISLILFLTQGIPNDYQHKKSNKSKYKMSAYNLINLKRYQYLFYSLLKYLDKPIIRKIWKCFTE